MTNVSNILIKLRQAVIGAQFGEDAATAERVQIQTLFSQISSNVKDATVNGVNLISGAVGNGVQTQINVPAGIDGQMMTIGGKGLSAMNASLAGLGLAGAPSSISGLKIECAAFSAENIRTAGPATQIIVQTANYGNASTESQQYLGQRWTFQFTDAADPTPASSTPLAYDTNGDVVQQDNVVPVPLKSGFTLSDAMVGLQRALSGAGFESSVAQQMLPGQSYASIKLGIAGNNIDPNAMASESVQHLQPSWPGPIAEIPGQTTAATLSGGTNLKLNSLPLPTGAGFASYVGAQYLGTDSDVSGYTFSNAAAAAFITSSSATYPTPDPNVGIQSGTTIQSIDAMTNTITLSQPVTKKIAIGQSVWLMMPLVPAFTVTPWTGVDASLATIDSAMAKVGEISQYLGNARDSLTRAQAGISNSIDNLNNGIGNLVDADMGKAGANLVAQQIRQRFAIQSLALANQSSSFLLQLFR
jgi:flagellin